MRFGKHGFVQHLDELRYSLGFRLRLSDSRRTFFVDFRVAIPNYPSLSGDECVARCVSLASRTETTALIPVKTMVVDVNASRDVAGVSTGRRDATRTFNRAVAAESGAPAFRSEGFAARQPNAAGPAW